MTARVTLKPGQKGTKSLVAKYGDALLCVRYRYDETNREKIKTVELIVERQPWTPAHQRYKENTLVPVRIGFGDTTLREQARSAKGKWDPQERVWYIPFGKIRGTELEKFIILETTAKKKSF